jgi:hypothetical protein
MTEHSQAITMESDTFIAYTTRQTGHKDTRYIYIYIYIKKLEDNIQEHGERLKSNAGDKSGRPFATVKEFYLQKIQD